MIYYFIIFLITLFTAYLFTIFAKNIASSIGAIDKPNDIKIHNKPIPRLGGLAIYVAFLISMILVYYFNNNLYFISKNKMIGIFIGGTIVFFTGLIDDIVTIKASYKLLIQNKFISKFVVFVYFYYYICGRLL